MAFPHFQPELFRILPENVLQGPKIELANEELWKQFSEFTTEMVITKSGRRMFPPIKLKLSGLEKKTKYQLMIEMIPSDDFRHKFANGRWTKQGKAEFEPFRPPVVYSDTPQTGEHWMGQGAYFKMLKLTNNNYSSPNHVFLNSMHRYHPRVHIVEYDRFDKPILASFKTFVLKYTDFIAVTAYQNDMITKMKIDYNPFAKGFRNKTEDRTKKAPKRMTPCPSEDEEPMEKKQKIESPSENMKVLPELNMDFLRQWQLLVMSSFGNLPIPEEPLKNTPVRKGGFGVMDLLGDIR